MNFLDALDILGAGSCPRHVTDEAVRFFSIHLLTGDNTVFDPHILYLCSPECFPFHLPDPFAVYSFLILSDPPQLVFPDLSRLNVAYLGPSWNPYSVTDIISQALGDELWIHNSMRIITAELFSGKGLQSLIDTAYTVFTNPIVVTDSSGKVIARAAGDLSNENNNAFITQVLCKDCITDTIYALSEDTGAKEEDSSSNHPHTVVHNVFGHDAMVGNVRVKGICVGRMAIFAQIRPFQEVDRIFFHRLLAVVGQELQKKTVFTQSHNEANAFLLNDLLSMEKISPATLEVRLNQVHFKPKSRFCVAAVELANIPAYADSSVFGIIADQLYSVLWGNLFLVRSDELVILFNLDEDKDTSGYINQQLTQQAISNKLIIGVSNLFDDLTLIKRHYEQAKRAIALGRRFEKTDVIYFSLAAPVELLHVVRQHDEIMDFCMTELLDLLRIDKDTSSNLMETLYVYLECFGNSAKAAQLLCVHKNTFLYRLAKVRQVIHCDLTRGEDIFRLMVSFRILRIQHIFVPRTPTPDFNIGSLGPP